MNYNYTRFEEQLEVLLGSGVVEYWEAFGVGHYRVNGVVDIWPRHRKYMNVETREHGEYNNLEKVFNQSLCITFPAPSQTPINPPPSQVVKKFLYFK